MDLVVGRIAKAHGITGEVVVDIRTDDPGARFSAGATLRGRTGRNGPEPEMPTTETRRIRPVWPGDASGFPGDLRHCPPHRYRRYAGGRYNCISELLIQRGRGNGPLKPRQPS